MLDYVKNKTRDAQPTLSSMRMHHRRRSQHNRRPPPAPVRLLLQTGSMLRLTVTDQHEASVAKVLDVARRLARRLFCSFGRWAAAVHRPVAPTTVPDAALILDRLRHPVTPLRLHVRFNQINAYSLGPGLILATGKLRRCELDDLRWLAHATNAWRIRTAGATMARHGFVGDAILAEAHADMVHRDGDEWGGLVPPSLVAMIRHGATKR